MNFGMVQCICLHCSCVDECEYFNDTIKPIVKSVVNNMTLSYDEFTSGILHVLREFECEYFER